MFSTINHVRKSQTLGFNLFHIAVRLDCRYSDLSLGQCSNTFVNQITVLLFLFWLQCYFISRNLNVYRVRRNCGYSSDIRVNLVHQTLETVLKFLVLSRINKRVDAAIAENHDDAEIVKPSVEVHLNADKIHQQKHLVACPADDEQAADCKQRFDDITSGVVECCTSIAFWRHLHHGQTINII